MTDVKKSRFDYVTYDEESTEISKRMKAQFQFIESQALTYLRPGRWRSELMTQLEYAYMNCGKAIRDDQIERGGSGEDLQERGDV